MRPPAQKQIHPSPMMEAGTLAKRYVYMIKSLDISNFRGFQGLSLEGLKPFNIIVGPNATGKTALLEAVFLASANSPETVFRLRLWRGLGQAIKIAREKTSYETLWRDLFFDEKVKSFSISVLDSEVGKRSCRVYYEAGDQSVMLPLDQQSIESTSIIPITFEWSSGERKSKSQVLWSDDELKLAAVPEALFRCVFLASGYKAGPSENARRYSDLSKENKERPVVEALQRMYPFIRDLSTEIDLGVPTLYASVQGLTKKLPLPFISEGANRYLSILLAIYYAPKGVVLVDEIENGFYHEKMASIWSGIVTECQQNQTQIFTTTHSMECLRALLPTIEKKSDDFGLLRTRRESKTGFCEVEQIDGMRLASALEEGFEIR